MRLSNWEAELQRELDAAAGRRFRWGHHDCCQFAALCVRAVCGYEGRLLFPRYRTRREAEQLLEAEGGMRSLLIKALGQPVEVWRARKGDIVLIDMGRGEQPAVCNGVKSYAPGRKGLEPWPTARASAAWVL
jgi:hypothetical protein